MCQDIVRLMRENPTGTFFLILAALWTIERIIIGIAHRNRPLCDCEVCTEADEEDSEDE